MPAKWVATRDVRLEDLTRYPGNARRGNIAEICKSITRHGQYRAIVVRQHDGKQTILAGNHTAEALTQLAENPPTVAQLLKHLPAHLREEQEPAARALLDQLKRKEARCEIIECSDGEALRINLADNRLSDIAEDDPDSLAELLAGLDGDYEGTGWAEEDITGILEQADAGSYDGDGDWDGDGNGDGDGEGHRGELLALAGVTLGEPRHTVETGQIWALGDHRLVIADVFTGWALWAPLLDGEATFLPYPTPLAPHALDTGPLVMVQPEPYLAGHLLDKWQNITGAAPVVVNGQVAA